MAPARPRRRPARPVRRPPGRRCWWSTSTSTIPPSATGWPPSGAPKKRPTAGGYLTVWADRATYNAMLAQGLRVEIDQADDPPGQQPRPVRPGQPQHLLRRLQDGRRDADLPRPEGRRLPHPGRESGYRQLLVQGPSRRLHRSPPPTTATTCWVLHITNQAIPGPKPVFWYDAGIHSREIATPEMAMRFISWLLDNYNTNADAHWLVDYHDIWVMPMLNPDGHHIVEAGGGGSSPYYQRKNARQQQRLHDLAAQRQQPVRHGPQPQLPLPVGLLRRLQQHRLRRDLSRPVRRAPKTRRRP